jgi:hypothetical protein
MDCDDRALCASSGVDARRPSEFLRGSGRMKVAQPFRAGIVVNLFSDRAGSMPARNYLQSKDRRATRVIRASLKALALRPLFATP